MWVAVPDQVVEPVEVVVEVGEEEVEVVEEPKGRRRT
jgi:hypothetical protein